jgi:hypothetical protein
MGLYDWKDFKPAWDHYCDGTGTPWSTPFASINWDDSNLQARIKGLVGGQCSDRTIPVNLVAGIGTTGADHFIIGHLAARAQGTIQVHCDCSWSFSGNESAALGHDIYDFDKNGSPANWTGRNRCPKKGKPFNIDLPGNKGLSMGGKIDGASTCKCK